MPSPSSDEILAELVKRRVSPSTILAITKLIADAAQTEAMRVKWRDDKRRQRACPPDVHQTSSDVRGPPPSHTLPPLPSSEEPIGSSLSGRAKRKRPLPADWNPILHSDAESHELKRFRDYCHANGKCYADWDAAWRNWLSSPYRKSNGGQTNGNGRRHGSILDACDRLERKIDSGEVTLDFGPSEDGSRSLSKR